MSEQFAEQADVLVDNDTSGLDSEPSEILDEDRLEADPLEAGMDTAEGYSRTVRLGGTEDAEDQDALAYRLPQEEPDVTVEEPPAARSRRPRRWTSTSPSTTRRTPSRGRGLRQHGRAGGRPARPGRCRRGPADDRGRRRDRGRAVVRRAAPPSRPGCPPTTPTARRWASTASGRPRAPSSRPSRGAGELTLPTVPPVLRDRRLPLGGRGGGDRARRVRGGRAGRGLAAVHERAGGLHVRPRRGSPGVHALRRPVRQRQARRGRRRTGAGTDTPCGDPHDVEVVGSTTPLNESRQVSYPGAQEMADLRPGVLRDGGVVRPGGAERERRGPVRPDGWPRSSRARRPSTRRTGPTSGRPAGRLVSCVITRADGQKLTDRFSVI